MARGFDYIVVGAGSAGCVIASRLTEDRDVSVLLLEAGGWDRHPLLRLPIAWVLCAYTPRFNWGHVTEPEPALDNRQIELPRGKMLGGSSSINGMMYVRGHPRDYDQWRQMGAEGWGYDDVLPYFKRSENSWRGEGKYHGGAGPLPVRQANAPHLLFDLISPAVTAAGHKLAADPHGDDLEGLSQHDLTVDSRGRRASTARTFLYPAMNRPNLTVITYALTTRVVVENGRAIGVEYMKDGKRQTVHAEREVILSGGAYNSPHLLLLSGIGPAEELRAQGIKLVHDLPGVGKNLSEHPYVPVTMAATRPITLLRHLRLDRATLMALRWALFGGGVFAFSGASANLFVRSRAGLERPDLQLILGTIGLGARVWMPWRGPGQNYIFNGAVSLLHPDARGSVTLRSANPADLPRVRLNLFSEKSDVDTAIRGIKAVREVYSKKPVADLISHELLPGAAAQSDAELQAHIRKTGNVTHHPCGTCRMGSDAMAVVDPQLRLRGISGLRVADASVMPTVPGGNINAPVIMIGEKAVDLIRGRQPARA